MTGLDIQAAIIETLVWWAVFGTGVLTIAAILASTASNLLDPCRHDRTERRR